ncbi:MAG: TRAP transporter substrate-binding protein DctP [Polyangiales bacterium]
MRCFWVMFGLCVAAACGSARPDASLHVLRYATPYPPQHPFSRADKQWVEHVEAASGGRLHIDPFWSGSISSADQSLLELRHGVADIAAIQPIYTRGGVHALRAQAAFYAGARTFEEQVTIYKCLARTYPALSAELPDLRVLAVQGGNLPGLLTRSRPIHSVRDLAGLRLRVPSELIGLMRALDADPVNMPMGDVYSALAKGLIDGVVAPPDTLRAVHLAEVGKHYAELEIPRGAYPARAIRSRSYERLPSDLRNILDQSSELWERALASELTQALEAGRHYGQEHGLAFTKLSEAEQQTLVAAYDQAARDQARSLTARGIAGPAMLESAHKWIRHLHDGPASAPASCAQD